MIEKILFIGCFQVNSDKSQTSLSWSGSVFNPLHLTLLSYLEELRRKLIEQGLTAFAYLRILFQRMLETF